MPEIIFDQYKHKLPFCKTIWNAFSIYKKNAFTPLAYKYMK